MKDTCVVQIFEDSITFSPDTGGAARLSSWPNRLRGRFRSNDIYVIRRATKSTPRAVQVVIVGMEHGCCLDGIPAKFADGSYGICDRFLHELGVTPPLERKRKTLYLVVTKRRAKK